MNAPTRPVKNGFATKADLRKLQKGLDQKFSNIDKRFANIDKRFEEIGFEIRGLKFSLDDQKEWMQQDLMRYFQHEWQQKIDPILSEIEHHRQKEVLWAEQNRRTEEKVDGLDRGLKEVQKRVGGLEEKMGGLEEKMGGLEEKMGGLEEKVDTINDTMRLIAKKVGA